MSRRRAATSTDPFHTKPTVWFRDPHWDVLKLSKGRCNYNGLKPALALPASQRLQAVEPVLTLTPVCRQKTCRISESSLVVSGAAKNSVELLLLLLVSLAPLLRISGQFTTWFVVYCVSSRMVDRIAWGGEPASSCITMVC